MSHHKADAACGWRGEWVFVPCESTSEEAFLLFSYLYTMQAADVQPPTGLALVIPR